MHAVLAQLEKAGHKLADILNALSAQAIKRNDRACLDLAADSGG